MDATVNRLMWILLNAVMCLIAVSSAADTDRSQFSVSPIPDKAVLVLYRPSGRGAALALESYLNDVPLAKLNDGSWVAKVVDPGEYDLWVRAAPEWRVVLRGLTSLQLEPNRVYYIRQQLAVTREDIAKGFSSIVSEAEALVEISIIDELKQDDGDRE